MPLHLRRMTFPRKLLYKIATSNSSFCLFCFWLKKVCFYQSEKKIERPIKNRVFSPIRFDKENIDKLADKFWFPFREVISSNISSESITFCFQNHKDFLLIQINLRRFFLFWRLKINSNRRNDNTESQFIAWKWSKNKNTCSRKSTTIQSIKRCQTTFKISNLFVDVHQSIFPCHPFHFHESVDTICWYRMTFCVAARGGVKRVPKCVCLSVNQSQSQS